MILTIELFQLFWKYQYIDSLKLKLMLNYVKFYNVTCLLPRMNALILASVHAKIMMENIILRDPSSA